MKTPLIFWMILAVCAALFFVVPHHRRNPTSLKPRTLGGVYRDFFREIRGHFTPPMQVMLMLAICGIVASFYPAIMVLMICWIPHHPGEGGGILFVLGGLVAGVGAIANVCAVLVAYMSFAWGLNSSSRDKTIGFFVIPIFHGLVAILSIGIGISAGLFNLAAGFILS